MGMEGYSLATFQAACASLFCERTDEEEFRDFEEQQENDTNNGDVKKNDEGEEGLEGVKENGLTNGGVAEGHVVSVEVIHEGQKEEAKQEQQQKEGSEKEKEGEEDKKQKRGSLLLRHPESGEVLVPILTSVPFTHLPSETDPIEMEELDEIPIGGWSIN